MADTSKSIGPKAYLTEDWAVVTLGFIIIFFVIAGLKFPAPAFGWKSTDELFSKVFSPENIWLVVKQFLLVYAVALLGTWATGKAIKNTALAFPLIYFLSFIALIITGNASVKSLNLEAVIFSLIIGLIISNFFKLPDWFRKALSSELFVKIGLVLLGTTIIFSDILKAGALGLAQALLVVVSVWYFAFWVSKKLKVDDEMGMMLSSAVSICGVSAAIATSGAIKGDSKKLSYIISLVLIIAIPMMIGMPYLAKWMGLSPQVTGAWLGGTIDTTGAVVASGTVAGEEALKISTIVKFSQNVLLGIAAFLISLYWTYSKSVGSDAKREAPTAKLIWERFPKFVLGFILASIFFSFVLSPDIVKESKDSLKSLQGLWFALAFICIGLETKFSEIFNKENKKPLVAFLTAQAFNIVVTLIIAYLLFR